MCSFIQKVKTETPTPKCIIVGQKRKHWMDLLLLAIYICMYFKELTFIPLQEYKNHWVWINIDKNVSERIGLIYDAQGDSQSISNIRKGYCLQSVIYNLLSVLCLYCNIVLCIVPIHSFEP